MKKFCCRKWCLLLTVVMLMVSLVGCGGSGNNTPTIDNLKVSVEEQVKDGEPDVMFWFENNSNFTITYLQIRYVPKDDVTKESLISAGFDYSVGLADDWTIDNVFMDGIVGEDDTVSIKPGETSSKTELHRNNIFYVRSIDEFNNMRPD